jgi:hypothetical protein
MVVWGKWKGGKGLDKDSQSYGVQEFARLAGMSRQWHHMLCKEGRGPKRIIMQVPDKRGRVSTRRGRVVIPKTAGDQWIASYLQTRN